MSKGHDDARLAMVFDVIEVFDDRSVGLGLRLAEAGVALDVRVKTLENWLVAQNGFSQSGIDPGHY